MDKPYDKFEIEYESKQVTLIMQSVCQNGTDCTTV